MKKISKLLFSGLLLGSTLAIVAAPFAVSCKGEDNMKKEKKQAFLWEKYNDDGTSCYYIRPVEFGEFTRITLRDINSSNLHLERDLIRAQLERITTLADYYSDFNFQYFVKNTDYVNSDSATQDWNNWAPIPWDEWY